MTLGETRFAQIDGKNLVDGTFGPALSGASRDMLCPSYGCRIGSIPASGKADIDAAVMAARKAFEDGAWSRLTAAERGRLLARLGQLIGEHRDELGDLEARDTGKPLRQAANDIKATERYFEYYAGAADKLHGESIPFLSGHQATALREPLGVTAHITPWNYPCQMFGRTLAPALAMGNAVILKPSEDACLAPLRIAELAMEAGFPGGALNVVCGDGEMAGAALAGHQGIDFVSFTGSPEAGAAVQAAAAAHHVACVMELGGKSPQILFGDADLDAALPVIANAIIQNAGQTCSAGSRALVEKTIFDQVMDELATCFAQLVAAPHDHDRDLGALISATQKQRVEGFLAALPEQSIVASGQLALGPSAPGHFIAPQLIANVDAKSSIAREEVFGPVLCCLPFADEEDAIRLANGTDYGLVAGVWTRDGARQLRVAKALRCGQVFVNCYGAGGGIELPFGGVGKSGYGREKGFEALREFSQLKTIVQFHG